MSAPHILFAQAKPRAYQQGSRAYLDNGVIKIGFELSWGGAVAELDWNGTNFINDHDTGRLVQVAFYDGDVSSLCGDCAGAKGWDPVQGGDSRKHGSPVLAKTIGPDSIYIKSQPHHWFPDNKSTGPNNPYPGDLYVEQWASLLPDFPNGVKLHYKVTHFGTDRHINSYQEFPAVYTNWAFNQFVFYGGSSPWTNDGVSRTKLPVPPAPSPTLFTVEQWGALVDDRGIGLTVYVPDQYPYAIGNSHPPRSGDANSGTNYFVPRSLFSFEPGAVLEGDMYLFGGDYQAARKAIYALRKTISIRDPFTPEGSVDLPKVNAGLHGQVPVSGWTFDNIEVADIQILVDEKPVGSAKYGSPRPDVANKWPHAPVNIGFSYTLDTSQLSNGKHVIGVNSKDSAGNVAVFRRIPVVVNNVPGGATAR
jgi:hypothetical protein